MQRATRAHLTKMDLQVLLADPVMRMVLHKLGEREQEILEKWGQGQFKTFAESEFHRGMLEGLRSIYEIEPDIEGDE